MQVAGVITEYNPFHNGHFYHLQKTRELTGADVVVCVMSGSFVQRGEPAIIDKWTRAEIACNHGADLVVELPQAFALRSAEHFAHGAVQLLSRMRAVDYLCFGSETGSLPPLKWVAGILARRPRDYRNALDSGLDQGLSFPQARQQALLTCLESTGGEFADGYESLREVILKPNNILGIEYLKAMERTDADFTPLTIKRIGADYSQKEITGPIASATALRETIKKAGRRLPPAVGKGIPQAAAQLLDSAFEEGRGPIFTSHFDRSLLLLLHRLSTEEIARICEVNEGLENRLKAKSRTAKSCEEVIRGVKTKRYTWTRIQRITAYILLGYTRDMARLFSGRGPGYIRILAFNPAGRRLLHNLRDKTAVPVISRAAEYQDLEPVSREMFEFDLRASDIHSLAAPAADMRRAGWDFKREVITVQSSG